MKTSSCRILFTAGLLAAVWCEPALAQPQVANSPKSQLVFAGERLILDAFATGSPPLSYQWQKDGANLGGETGTNLVIASVQLSDIGSYSVVVTNAYGAATSTSAVLTMVASPSYNLSPPSTVVSLGGPAVPTNLDDVIAIGAGYGQQLAVRSNGTVVCWGNTIFGSAQPPSDLSNVVAVASGGLHSIALRRDGTVVGWGYKGNPPAGLFGVVAIASGHDHSIALKADGTTVTWGGIIKPPPPGNTNFVAIAAGSDFSIGLRNDGTVPPLGEIFGFPGESNITAIAATGLAGLSIRL